MTPTKSARRTPLSNLVLAAVAAAALGGCAPRRAPHVANPQRSAMVSTAVSAADTTRAVADTTANAGVQHDAQSAIATTPARFDEAAFARRFELDATRPPLPPAGLAKAAALGPAVGSKHNAPAALAPACPPEGTRVLLIGDSLSHGLAPVMARQAKRCNTPFFHKGVVGSHVTQWAQDHWLQPQLTRSAATVVMVSLGGNDFQRTDPHNVRAAIPKFISKVQHSGARLMWISPPTMPFSDTIGVRGMWHHSIDDNGLVDVFAAEALNIPRSGDKIHPNARGNRALSAKLWLWMSARQS